MKRTLDTLIRARLQPEPNAPETRTTEPQIARHIISRRSFLKGVGGLAVGLGIGVSVNACAPPRIPSGRDANAPTEEPVQLVYQDWQTEWFPPMVQRMLEQFHDEHPFIRVFYKPDPDNVAEVMLAEMQAGTAPDVYQGCCTFFPIWAQNGYTLDLNSFVETHLDQSIIDDWSTAQYQSFFLKDGHQFGLPKYHGALALYYNKDLFDQYDVEYPNDEWTYDEYLDAMHQLTHDRDGDGEIDLWGSMTDISWDRLQIHVNGFGGHLVDPGDPATCHLTSSNTLEALEWIRARMWDDQVMATFPDVQNMTLRNAFIDERIAMVEEGSWALKDILTGSKFNVGVAPFPVGPKQRVTLATTDGFGIYSETQHAEASWELMEFLISQDYGRAMAHANFLQPARASVVDDWVGYIQQEFFEETKDVNIAAFADGHLQGYSVTIEISDHMAELQHQVYEAWDSIFTWGEMQLEQMTDVCSLNGGKPHA
ncbi:sugar ABC transporter substrate-binding protein [Chloroflexi bacterium TSY]|nr:sugar ABC transporter substrate-binding protein [Chloroflexi bacterium TSY]